VVVRDSYARFAHSFNTKHLNNKQVKVVLKPALTAVACPKGSENYFAMSMDIAWGSFDYLIDWGDGTNETWPAGVTNLVEHYYQQPGLYFISITGHGLDSLVNFGNVPGNDLERLGLEHLLNLRDFRIEYGHAPKVIDLSHCPFLSEIRIYPPLGQGSRLEDLIIPDNAFIVNLEIGGNINLKQESLNEIINDIHYQTVNHYPRGGVFWYSLLEDNDIPMVEPSPEALEKVTELKHEYDWWVIPDPDLAME
jgi:hypothetical protein